MTTKQIIETVKKELKWNLDEKLVAKAYRSYFKSYKKMGNDDLDAHKKSIFMIDYYSHQFRKYGETINC